MDKITEYEFSEMVSDLFKDGNKIHYFFNGDKMEELHAAIGVAGEAGEVLDLMKKKLIHNKDVSRDLFVEELGDVEFYLEALRKRLRITREETLKANMKKLGIRYQGYKYSDDAANNRVDKAS